MMRNIVTSLLEHGQIKTTITRAKEMRKYTDKMIGLAKRNASTEGGDLHAKRQAMSFLKNKAAYHRLFDEYGELFKDRNGGYTRIYKLGNRLGDNADMALIQLIGAGEGEGNEVEASSNTAAEVNKELKETQTEEVAQESTKVEAASSDEKSASEEK